MTDHDPRNVTFKKKGDNLVVTMALSVEGSDSSTGKTTVLASIRGEFDLGEVHKDLKGVTVHINKHRKIPMPKSKSKTTKTKKARLSVFNIIRYIFLTNRICKVNYRFFRILLIALIKYAF